MVFSMAACCVRLLQSFSQSCIAYFCPATDASMHEGDPPSHDSGTRFYCRTAKSVILRDWAGNVEECLEALDGGTISALESRSRTSLGLGSAQSECGELFWLWLVPPSRSRGGAHASARECIEK